MIYKNEKLNLALKLIDLKNAIEKSNRPILGKILFKTDNTKK